MIEDNPLLTKLYGAAFEDAGFEFMSAHEGETGLALAKDRQPDAIILDLLMPGADGFTILQKIKKDQAMKRIKVIIATAARKEHDMARAKELGAVDFFIKPEITLADLVRRVISHIDGGDQDGDAHHNSGLT